MTEHVVSDSNAGGITLGIKAAHKYPYNGERRAMNYPLGPLFAVQHGVRLLTPEQLKALIAGGETLDVEFKGERTKPLPDGDVIEAVVCLANRGSPAAGYLLIGVENDGTVTGAHLRGRTSINPLQVQGLIAGRTRPSISCPVEVVIYEDKQVVVVEVASSKTPIASSDGTYLRRIIGADGKPQCLPFFFDEMQSRQSDQGWMTFRASRFPEFLGTIWTRWSLSVFVAWYESLGALRNSLGFPTPNWRRLSVQ